MGILSSHNSDHQNAPILNFIWKFSQNEQFIDKQTKFDNFRRFSKISNFSIRIKVEICYILYLFTTKPIQNCKTKAVISFTYTRAHIRIGNSSISDRCQGTHPLDAIGEKETNASFQWMANTEERWVCLLVHGMDVCVRVYAFECALGMVWIVWVCVHRCVSVLFCESLGNRR